jgi:phosphoribosylaminoimidazole-succinocarboxamide synthase
VAAALDDLTLLDSGKVREIYDLDGRLLLVTSDRISTYDVVHPTPIPGKGAVLTGLSAFWFQRTRELVANHFVSVTDEVPSQARGRGMVVKRLAMLPVECVVRGYLSGSGWKDYEATGTVSGIELPAGLRESDRLPEPIFTPSTKATAGHDEAIEFGLDADGTLTLGDEVCTPDSSRFWPADEYQAGRGQASFDKQFVRDWASSTGWDRTPPAPEIPGDVVARTREKYVQAYEQLTGEPFTAWLDRTGATS